MATKRDLKKQINGLLNELDYEVIIISSLFADVDFNKAAAVIREIEKIRKECFKRVYACGDKDAKRVKIYYKKLKEDFLGNVNEIVKQIKDLH